MLQVINTVHLYGCQREISTLYDVDTILGRMVEACGVKNTSQMLEMCGFSSGAAGAWKRRKKIPDGSIAKVAERASVRFEWLKFGEGTPREPYDHRPALNEHIAEAEADYHGKATRLTRQEFILLTIFRQLDEEGKNDVIDEAALTLESLRTKGPE